MKRCSYFRSFIYAEFIKLSKLRTTRITYAIIPPFIFLFAFQLYYFGDIHQYLQGTGHEDVMSAFPMVFFFSWRTWLFQLFIIAYAVFCTSSESQYGMIRVLAAQPLSRIQYYLAKHFAVAGHVALMSIVFAAACCFWALLYSGVPESFHAGDIARILVFILSLAAFTSGLGWAATSAAFLRKTIASSLAAAMSLLLVLPVVLLVTDVTVLNPYFFIFYWKNPMFHLQYPAHWTWLVKESQTMPARTFMLAALITIGTITIPAARYFCRRDIDE